MISDMLAPRLGISVFRSFFGNWEAGRGRKGGAFLRPSDLASALGGRPRVVDIGVDTHIFPDV